MTIRPVSGRIPFVPRKKQRRASGIYGELLPRNRCAKRQSGAWAAALLLWMNMCVGCGQCTTKCKFDAIKLERVYDGEGVQFLDMKPVVVKQMVKRQGKIAAKKVKSVFGGKN